jgi:hypothetical protein
VSKHITNARTINASAMTKMQSLWQYFFLLSARNLHVPLKIPRLQNMHPVRCPSLIS